MGNKLLKINTWVKDDEDRIVRYFNKKPRLSLDIDTIKKVDLRNNAPPIYNTEFPQLCNLTNENVDLMFATPNAIVSVCEYLNKKNGKIPHKLSRMFVYYNAKDNRHVINKDIPVSFIDCIETIKNYGICSDEMWTYDIEKSNLAPVKQCNEEAKKNKYFSFYKLDQNEIVLKKCITSGEPFLFGLYIYQNFLNLQTSDTLNMPNENDQQIGEYATACFGYDDTKKMFLCRGSFGEKWGTDGYFWISYEYVLSKKCDNFWNISLIA
jgi:hypothetical protein